MFRPTPTTGQIYHVYNRGVEKRKIFLDNRDYFRLIHDLFEFNDVAPAVDTSRHIIRNNKHEVGLRVIRDRERRLREPRKLLVEIICFCLMPNHFHLLVKQLVDDGITEFMRKIGTGYTNYFNKKYDRVGPLFQGKYKAILVKNTSHFLHLPYYIHCNSLDLKFPEWREGKLKNTKKALSFLEKYRWSSYLDYIGKKNFPSVTQRELLTDFYGGEPNYKRELKNWLRNINVEEINSFSF